MKKQKLTKSQVEHVATLANLPLKEEEKDSPRFADEAGKYSEQLSKILDYIDQLSKVDTSDVEPTFNVSGSSNKFRKDKTEVCLTQEEALSNAPKKENGQIVTKGVFHNG